MTTPTAAPQLPSWRALGCVLLSLGLTGCADPDPAEMEATGDPGDATQTSGDAPVTTGDPPAPTTGGESADASETSTTTPVDPGTTSETTTDGLTTAPDPETTGSTSSGDSTAGDDSTSTGDSTADSTGDEPDTTDGDPPDPPQVGPPIVEMGCFWSEAIANRTTQATPGGFVLADFDDDGFADIAARVRKQGLLPSSSGIAMLRNQGDGSFAAGEPYALGGAWEGIWGSWSIAAADLDGDGDLDLATIDSEHTQLHLLFNQGAGSFGAPVSYAGLISPESVVTADLDDDGEIDVATLSAKGVIVVRRNLGGGALGEASSYATGSPNGLSRPFHVADLNADGLPDLVVPSLNDDRIYIQFNQGDGVFGVNTIVGVGDSPSSAAAGDFNKDGIVDLAIGHGAIAHVGVLLGTGGGTFAPEVPYMLENHAVDTLNVIAADLDGDGNTDLFTTVPGGHRLNLVRGLGDGTFEFQGHARAGEQPVAIAAGDVDHDGRVDIVASNYEDLSFSILHQNANGSFGQMAPRIDAKASTRVLIGELTGDAVLDVVTLGDGRVRVQHGLGGGAFAPPDVYKIGGIVLAPQIGDLDADGRGDIVACAGDGVAVLHNQGEGKFAVAKYPSGKYSQSLVLADFNGDDRLDTAVAQSQDLMVLFGQPGAAFGAPTQYLALSSPTNLQTADYNEDGKPDLAVLEETDFPTHNVTLLLNDGNGVFTPTTVYQTQEYAWFIAADFSKDGHLDLAVAQGSALRILLGKGNGQFQPGNVFVTGIHKGKFLQTGDLDGDAILDLVVPGESSPAVGVLRGLGGGNFGPVKTYLTHVGETGSSVAIVDLDGDADLDLFFAGSGLATLQNHGDGTFAAATAYSAHWSRGLTVSEVDGDDRSDILIAADSGTHLLTGKCP